MQFFPSGGNSEFSTKTENHPYMFCSMNHQIKNYPQSDFTKSHGDELNPEDERYNYNLLLDALQ
ncbi:hypothetical protein NC653_028124 [Populus alba x Populus x berolinensis]|uniref:Uncharacterized protein n=1 Tax=Populus alba x Populus x berolinensis TaxID=444605 RepID=A0AAD6M7M4_9ROSI|nr:hypothetical protein NC653_028124 [Populus alba x Populus x berolinensis]